mmetsp:Transcript_5219/g.15610  ORF Transcript_5219/g.15610 Transcript_5219/m.15610 type:complete len:353 (+) Transcript_5219:675-1733(+)
MSGRHPRLDLEPLIGLQPSKQSVVDGKGSAERAHDRTEDGARVRHQDVGTRGWQQPGDVRQTCHSRGSTRTIYLSGCSHKGPNARVLHEVSRRLHVADLFRSLDHVNQACVVICGLLPLRAHARARAPAYAWVWNDDFGAAALGRQDLFLLFFSNNDARSCTIGPRPPWPVDCAPLVLQHKGTLLRFHSTRLAPSGGLYSRLVRFQSGFHGALFTFVLKLLGYIQYRVLDGAAAFKLLKQLFLQVVRNDRRELRRCSSCLLPPLISFDENLVHERFMEAPIRPSVDVLQRRRNGPYPSFLGLDTFEEAVIVVIVAPSGSAAFFVPVISVLSGSFALWKLGWRGLLSTSCPRR